MDTQSVHGQRSTNLSPKEDATDLNSGQIGGNVFGVTGGNVAPTLGFHEGVFEQMT
jgi:hypothetical protein